MSRSNVLLERTISVFLWMIGGVLFIRYLLPPLLPFILALALSALLEPTVQKLRTAIGVKRSFAAAVLTTFVLVVVGGGLSALLLRIVLELQKFAAGVSAGMADFPELWNGMLDELASWYANCSPSVRAILDLGAEQLAVQGPALAARASSWLMGVASGILTALPGIGLFAMTTLLAVYFTSVSYPSILAFLKRQLPSSWQVRCRKAVYCFRSTVLKWLRSELIMLFVVFSLLLAGFLWMGLDFALLAASVTALVDALPVLGTGTILVPWAVVSFLTGNVPRGTALLALYAAVLLTRSILEPKLLAGQGDLPPITALLAMYLGFSIMGVGGMLLFPLLLLLLKQFHDSGVLRIWR